MCDAYKIIRGLQYIQPTWDQLDYKATKNKLYTQIPSLRSITGRRRQLTLPLSSKTPDFHTLVNTRAEVVIYTQKVDCSEQINNNTPNKLKRKGETDGSPSTPKPNTSSAIEASTMASNIHPLSGTIACSPEVQVSSIYSLPSFFQNLEANKANNISVDKPANDTDLHEGPIDIMN
ncbi:unnamed protein product [Orchesella dallaii]|uniref:Uncharacterized protein n=1 Tax=Orchesella dallaii TaxID=48710 RepID=A0ABP1Q4Z7_9HEXA